MDDAEMRYLDPHDDEGAQDGQEEGDHHEDHRPGLEGAAALLDDGRVDRGDGGKPGEEGGNELEEKRTTLATKQFEKRLAARANPVMLSAWRILSPAVSIE